MISLRVRFFKKIQDWILKSEIIRKRILRFFTQQINPRSFGSRCLKGAEESTPRVDSSVPLIHHDLRDLGLICLVKKRKIRFRILSDLRIQSWIFFKETHPKCTAILGCVSLKKIQDWILKSEIIRKRILRFFTQQINPRSFGSRCLKGAEESTPRVDSSIL